MTISSEPQGNALDQYLKTYEKFLLLVDFNAGDTESIVFEFLEQYEAKNIMKIKPALKTQTGLLALTYF